MRGKGGEQLYTSGKECIFFSEQQLEEQLKHQVQSYKEQ